MIHIKFGYIKGTADNIGLVKPFCRGKLFFRVFLDHVLGKSQQISGIGIFKGCQRHGILCCKLYGLVINHLNAVHTVCSGFHKSVISNAFKYIIHHSRVIDYRAGQAQGGVSHILCRNRRSVGPGRRFINMNDEITVILRSDGICQHSLEIQVRIQLHKGKEHQRRGIFVDFSAV